MTGSSPRMRGTRSLAALCRPARRFIPAYAGNATAAARRAGVGPVHPRVCGERFFVETADLLAVGSSPRMRGTPHHRPQQRHARRFIPAYAGNALSGSTNGFPSPVHPRVCGERFAFWLSTMTMIGSSPRMRGTREIHPTTSPAGSVHPRVCGERIFDHWSRVASSGSSPRMRGTRV